VITVGTNPESNIVIQMIDGRLVEPEYESRFRMPRLKPACVTGTRGHGRRTAPKLARVAEQDVPNDRAGCVLTGIEDSE
jgi:hypothetical protein